MLKCLKIDFDVFIYEIILFFSNLNLYNYYTIFLLVYNIKIISFFAFTNILYKCSF